MRRTWLVNGLTAEVKSAKTILIQDFQQDNYDEAHRRQDRMFVRLCWLYALVNSGVISETKTYEFHCHLPLVALRRIVQKVADSWETA